jgi:signal transduction histidine kinase
MALSESIEKILQNTNGQASLENINERLGKKYSRQTILDVLHTEKDLFTFDGETVTLIKYPVQYFIRILEDYIRDTNANPSDIYYAGAYFLFLRRQIPRIEPVMILEELKKRKDLESGDIILKIEEIAWDLEISFAHAIKKFFDTGWIERYDSKELYSFSLEFYEYFLRYTIYGFILSFTPSTLVQLICQIVPNDRSLEVYNPFAGMLKLLTAIKVNAKFDIIATASEINQEIYDVGDLFAKTNGFNLNFNNLNSLDEVVQLGSHSYDLIVSIPPFTAKVDPSEQYNQAYKNVSLNLISDSLYHLKDNGMAIFLVPENVLFGQTQDHRRFRREITERKLIHTIISLPVQLFPYSAVKTSLLIFRKGINHQSVRFIDASSKSFFSSAKNKIITLEIEKIKELMEESYQPKQVHNDQGISGLPEVLDIDFNQIKKEGSTWNLNNFFFKFIQPTGEQYVALGQITTQLRLQTNPGIELPYIRITDLNGGVIEKTSHLSINRTRTKGKILNEQAFLIGTVGGSSKPSWYPSESPIEISTNIVALKVDPQKVDNGYLLQELNSTYVQDQMDFLSIGSTSLSHLRIEDLLKIKIKLPSLLEQIKISINRKEFMQQQSLTSKSNAATITDADIFKAINHEIGNILKGPEGFLDLLPDFLMSNKISLDKPIVDAKDAESIGEMISMAGKKIKNVYEVMQNMKGIIFSDKKYFKAEKIELKKYFREKLHNEIIHRNIKYYIGSGDNFINPTSIYGVIDPIQFQYIVRNIVTNAMNHSGIAFDKGEHLNLFINIDAIENELEIHFMNNGNAFPSDFTVDNYLEFNKKSGNSKGQGLGGYLIGRIVENHSGKIRIQSEKRIIKVKQSDKDIFLEANIDIVITIPKVQ